jgi:hypothetical protein
MSDSPPFAWVPGEHVAVIGDTGTGKTYLLAKALLRYRRYVVVLKTKPDPDDADKWTGFHRARKAQSMSDERYERILLEPEYRYQAIEGYRMLDRAWKQGGWTVVIDEGWYAEQIGLKPYIERLLTQGRSKGISVVYGQQRPVATSRFVISQATHVITFRVEGRDAKTVAESTTPRILPVIDDLAEREFAYYHRAKRYVGKGTARRLGALIVPIGQKSSGKALDRVPLAAGRSAG